jgi:methyl-accepting chemotaxis protein
LIGVSESTARIAEHVLANPGELREVAETAKNIGTQLTDMAYDVERVADGYESLREKTTEATKTADWLGEQYNGGVNSGNNAFGRMSDFS